MKNAVNWFELPVQDLGRAQRFYERVLGAELRSASEDGVPMAIFPYDGGVGGALVHDPRVKPATDGTIVYLDARGGLDGAIARIAEAGGRVVLPKTDIGPPGFIAILVDTEGNRVGLHQAR